MGSVGRGALEFRPDQSVFNTADFHDFEFLADETQRILTTDHYEGEAIDDLYRRGGSPGVVPVPRFLFILKAANGL